MKSNRKAVEKIISDAMRKLAAKLTTEQRKANGKKSWRTRREKLAKELAGA